MREGLNASLFKGLSIIKLNEEYGIWVDIYQDSCLRPYRRPLCGLSWLNQQADGDRETAPNKTHRNSGGM